MYTYSMLDVHVIGHNTSLGTGRTVRCVFRASECYEQVVGEFWPPGMDDLAPVMDVLDASIVRDKN